MNTEPMKYAAALLACCALALRPGPAGARELRHREITIGDRDGAAVPKLHVAPGLATVLVFQANVRQADFMRAVNGQFQKITSTPRTVVIVPKEAITRPVTLNVAMADGTVLTFALITVPNEMDAQVDVSIALRNAPDSPVALNAQIAKLDGKLATCEGDSETAGVERLGKLILTHGTDDTRAFETHALRGADRQNRLVVKARRMYRMLAHTFVVLSVDNRDPGRNWQLGKAEVRLTGGGPDVELTVAAHPTDMPELPPDTDENVVVAFKTPKQLRPDQRIAITLVERDGSRRVELRDLEL